MKSIGSNIILFSTLGAIITGVIIVLTDDDLKKRAKDQIMTLMDSSQKIIAAVKKASDIASDSRESSSDLKENIASQWRAVEDKLQR